MPTSSSMPPVRWGWMSAPWMSAPACSPALTTSAYAARTSPAFLRPTLTPPMSLLCSIPSAASLTTTGKPSASASRAAYADVVAAGRAAGADVQGALVQPQRAGGIELLVGVVTDPAWGQVLAVGLGGIWVEILADTALSVLPVDRARVLQALRSLRGARLFDGPRGTAKADLDAVADAITAVADLAGRLGDRLEALEINPLLVRGSQVEALDALITWRQP